MLGTTLDAAAYVRRLQTELSRVSLAELTGWADLIYDAWDKGRFVFVCGNGGAATTSGHITEDFGKSLLRQDDLKTDGLKRLKILSLADNVGWLTSLGNDVGFDQIFVQQLMNYGSKGDVLIAVSGSGNSPNLLAAAEWANRHGLVTFGLTGYDGGKLKQLCQTGLHVPLDDMGMVQGIHLCLFHWVLDDVHARINRVDRHASKK